LNDAEIQKALVEQPANSGGLNRFQQFLVENGHADADSRIRSLRIVQELRSTGAAHGKGEKFQAALRRANLDGLPLVEASMEIFRGVADFIEWMRISVLKA